MLDLTDLEERIDPETLAELREVPLVRGRPLLAVDTDEVMVEFASHVTRWLPSTGHEMRLNQYRLEGSMFRLGEDVPLPFQDCIALLDRFFRQQTLEQCAVTGAVEALERLSRDVQVVILTNVPRFARADRRQNTAALGMDYPLVVNSGGKGRALAWMAARAAAPAVFIDDSPLQHEHAAKHAPGVTRIHFVGASAVQELLRESPEADYRAHDWTEAEAQIREALGV